MKTLETTRPGVIALGFFLFACGAGTALAKVSAEEAARLGKDLTPIGAEKAGMQGPHGLEIPPWEGGWTEPGGDKRVHAPADPFADEEPLFIITAANAEKYKDILTEGQRELLKLYRDSFKMKVYPSHRTAAEPEHVATATLENATRVELTPSGSGFEGTAHGYPFPIPKTGQEVIWNHMARYRTTGFRGFSNSAITTASGDFVIERGYIELVIDYGNPDIKFEDWDNTFLRVLSKVVAPANKAGESVLAHVPMDREKKDIQLWSYNAGTRKVLRVGEVGYDNPYRDGLMTQDQIDMFNGSLDRYDFKLIGKKAVLVPYNSHAIYSPEPICSPELKYSDIIQRGHPNPDLMRFELHRTWVLEATVREGKSHIYKRRVFYLDEDSWLVLLQDMYDTRDQFWRTSMAFAMQYPQIPLMVNVLQAHYDLQSRRYVMLNMQNEEEVPVEYDFNAPASAFTTSALKRFGSKHHR